MLCSSTPHRLNPIVPFTHFLFQRFFRYEDLVVALTGEFPSQKTANGEIPL